MATSAETPGSLSSAPTLSRRAKGMIAALSAVITLATGVVSLRDQLFPAHTPTTAGVASGSTGAAAPKATASVAGHRAGTTHRSATSSSPAPPLPIGATDCGGGLHAGPNTSCPFARNVRAAYDAAPGSAATMRVFSPVTGQTYTMSCAAAGSGVTCSGANNASVTWSG